MRGSRTKNEDKAKVIAAKIKNPDATLREIQEKTGVNLETARGILKNDLPKVRESSEIITEIVENGIETVRNMSELALIYSESVLHKAKTEKELDRSDLIAANTVTSDSFKRSQLLSGKPTDRVETLTDDQLARIASAVLPR